MRENIFSAVSVLVSNVEYPDHLSDVHHPRELTSTCLQIRMQNSHWSWFCCRMESAKRKGDYKRSFVFVGLGAPFQIVTPKSAGTHGKMERRLNLSPMTGDSSLHRRYSCSFHVTFNSALVMLNKPIVAVFVYRISNKSEEFNVHFSTFVPCDLDVSSSQ